MGVLAVAKGLAARQAQLNSLGENFGIDLPAKELSDRCIVSGCMGESSAVLLKAVGAAGRAAVFSQVAEDFFVLGGLDGDEDEAVILGGGTNHRGAADVDVFDRLFQRHAGLGDGFLERVEVDAEQIDRLNSVGG